MNFKTAAGKRKVFLWTFALIALLFVLALAFNLYERDVSFAGGDNKDSDEVSLPSVNKVILISVDTLRPDFLGCYDSSRRTPAIDSLSEEGVLFEDAQCHNPLTTPSHATMLTGLHSRTHGLRANRGKISSKVKVLAEVLKEEGWSTGGFVSLPTVSAKFGFNRGFDNFDDSLKTKIGFFSERRAMDTVKVALEWLDKNREDKTFLFLHLADPHGPYKPPKKYVEQIDQVKEKPVLPLSSRNHPRDAIPKFQNINDRREADFYIKRYEAEVKYVDDSLGLFFQKLKEWGLYDKSLIIFTSDHGEAMGEHHIWFQHGTSLFISQTAVPLIFKYPGCKEGRRIKGMVGIADLMPTILHFLETSDKPHMHGSSLVKFMEHPDKKFEIPWYGDIKHLRRYEGDAVTNNEMKLIVMKGKKPKMFDLKEDPLEKENVIDKYPARKNELMNALKEHLSDLTLRKARKQNLSPREKKKRKKSMKALGYIDD